MKWYQSALIVLLALFVEVFILSWLPLLNITVPAALIVIALLFKTLHLEATLIAVVAGGFLADTWIAAEGGSILIGWVAVALVFAFFRLFFEAFMDQRPMLRMSLLALVFICAPFALQIGTGPGMIVGVQYTLIATTVSLVCFTVLQWTSRLLGKVI